MIFGAQKSAAQQFTVESYRELTNDVSGFITPVRDNNGDDCALLKVVGSEDFAFSTPLGIVKRIDKTGEIWLYLPQRSKRITIKHPQWGVMRDFHFTSPLVSHMSYELRIKEPATPESIREVITTVTDTLVLTRVDTLKIETVQPPVPLTITTELTAAFGGALRATLGGVMITAMKTHGVFIHALTNFRRSAQTVGTCNSDGMIDGRTRFYSGNVLRSVWLANAGAAHRISDRLTLYEGLGYGISRLDWELAPSEGGGYVRNTDRSSHGVTLEAGCRLNSGPLSLVISVITLRGAEWFGAVGIGYRFGRQSTTRQPSLDKRTANLNRPNLD